MIDAEMGEKRVDSKRKKQKDRNTDLLLTFKSGFHALKDLTVRVYLLRPTIQAFANEE